VTPRADLGNYNISFAKGTLSVTKAPLTVTTKDATKVYGAANPTFDVGYTGFVNGDRPRAWAAPSASTRRHAEQPVGSYDVTPKGLTSNNYNITFAKGTLSVTKATLTVTADNKSKVYGAANPTFTGTLTAS
jgi:hypothetical protein